MSPFMDKAKTAVIAGIAAGILDTVYFSARAYISDSTPGRIMQAIASFWIGPSSYEMGAASMAFGLATHFGLSILMAAGFVFAAIKLSVFKGRLIVAGPLYGALLFAVMNLIVLPLRWPEIYPRYNGWASTAEIGLHLAFGAVIVWVVRRRAAA